MLCLQVIMPQVHYNFTSSMSSWDQKMYYIMEESAFLALPSKITMALG